MSFKPEVSTDGGKSYGQNNLAFATEAEALASAKDLFHRWILVTDYRAVESDQPVNYALVDGVLTSVEVVGMTEKHECGLDRTFCTKCQTELEIGQVGLCDECRPKKWYALNQEGDMVYIGEFDDFTDADESLDDSPAWIVDEEAARIWLSQLKELLA